MKKLPLFIYLLCLVSLFSACIETKQTYIVNPDLSGKVDVESYIQPLQFGMEEDQNNDALMKNSVKKIIENSKGIEIWKNISYTMQDDGRILFKGTAYYKDITKLELYNMLIMHPKIKKPKKDEIILTLMPEEKKGEKSVQTEKPKKLSGDELSDAIRKERTKYQQSKPMMNAFLATLKIETSYQLPGTISKINNFEKVNQNTVRIFFEGQKLMEVMDAMVADDKWMEYQVSSGKEMKDPPIGNEVMNQKLFGQKAPISVTYSKAAKPLFNYKNEVSAGRKDFAALMQKLEITPVETPPAKGGDFKSLKIGGVLIIYQSDWKQNVRPFNYDTGYSLSLIGELPGAVLNITGGKLEKAVTDIGQDLLPETDWDKEIKYPRLSQDKTIVNFDVKMKLPDKKAKLIKELSGTLEYISSEGTEKKDLGIKALKQGSQGNYLHASITAIKENTWQKDSYILDLNLNLTKDELKSISFLDDQGNRLSVKESGYFGSGNNMTTFSYSLEGQYPDKGRIEVEIFKTKKYIIPFKLKNIALTGEINTK